MFKNIRIYLLTNLFAIISFFCGLTNASLQLDSNSNLDRKQTYLTEYQTNILQQTLRQKEAFLSGCRDCTFATYQQAPINCQEKYSRLFNKYAVNIYITLGYMDSTGGQYGKYKILPNSSIDQSAKQAIKNMLTKSCNAMNGACGFLINTNNSNHLRKTVHFKNNYALVNIYLEHSSHTSDLSINTTSEIKDQISQTQKAENNFFSSLNNSDITIYLGHARSGGGPDFAPPVLNKSGKADYYGYYKTQKPGLKKLIRALSESAKKPEFLAILGCKSDDLFSQKIMSAYGSNNLTLLTNSDVIDMSSGLKELYHTVDGLLRFECFETLERSINIINPRSGSKAIIN